MTSTLDLHTIWSDSQIEAAPIFASQDAAATEITPKVSPVWGTCVDTLIELRAKTIPLEATKKLEGDAPNSKAIEAACVCLIVLKNRYPSFPPTCLIDEPNGGIIIERRWLHDTKPAVCQLIFYNDETAETIFIYDGKVKDIREINFTQKL